MTHSNRPYLLALLLGAATSAAAPPLKGEEILRRVAKASRRVPYTAVRQTTLWLERHEEAFESTETTDGSGRFRVVYTAPRSAKGRMVIDDGTVHWQVEPDGRVMRSATSPLDDQEQWDLGLLLRNYSVTLDPALHNVARQPVFHLELRPKTHGKPREDLWVDRSTYVVLRREARHADGSPARVSRLLEIKYRPRTQADQFAYRPAARVRVQHAAPASHCKSPGEAAKYLGSASVVSQRLPLGFVFHNGLCRARAGKRTAQLLFSDGLETLSVFVDTQAPAAQINGARAVSVAGHPGHVKTSGHFSVVRWASGPLRYTLVGDLTQEALLNVAGGLFSSR